MQNPSGHLVSLPTAVDRCQRPLYRPPHIVTHLQQELLEMMGPAQAVRSFCDTTYGDNLVDCDY